MPKKDGEKRERKGKEAGGSQFAFPFLLTHSRARKRKLPNSKGRVNAEEREKRRKKKGGGKRTHACVQIH